MGTEIIEMGKISSRGQVAIPADIRNELGLHDGSKVLFIADKDILIMKKVTSQTFAEITKPFRQAKKKIKENEVNELVHKFRKSR